MKYLLLILLLLSCSNSKQYNKYKVTYEVIYPNKIITKTCIVNGEISEGYYYSGGFFNTPLIKVYYIKGNKDKDCITEYYPVMFKSKSIINN